MSLNKQQKEQNSAFFAGTEEGGDPPVVTPVVTTEENHMAEGLEAEAVEADDKEDDNFIFVNEGEETVVPEGEETKVETIVEPTAQEKQMTDMLGALGTLTNLQKSQMEQAASPAPEVIDDPEPTPDYSDAESVKSWTEWQTRESARTIDATIKKYHTENVLPVQNLALQQAHTSQLAEAKANFGERFDWPRDQKAIEAVMLASPGMSVSDGFRHVDYSRLQEQSVQKTEKTAELANTTTVNSGPSSTPRSSAKTTLVITEQDRKMAKNFDMDIKVWMREKHAQESNPGSLTL